MPRDELVSISEVAGRLGMDRSHCRKYALANGFEFVRVRTPESRGQLTLALAENEVEALAELRERAGYVAGSASSRPVDNGHGAFYIVRLVPDLAPNRIKPGFAVDADGRLQAHRVSAPTAQLVKTWRCRRSWEAAAIASATREGCKSIGGEVFDCESVERLVDRCDAFFAIMPG